MARPAPATSSHQSSAVRLQVLSHTKHNSTMQTVEVSYHPGATILDVMSAIGDTAPWRLANIIAPSSDHSHIHSHCRLPGARPSLIGAYHCAAPNCEANLIVDTREKAEHGGPFFRVFYLDNHNEEFHTHWMQQQQVADGLLLLREQGGDMQPPAGAAGAGSASGAAPDRAGDLERARAPALPPDPLLAAEITFQDLQRQILELQRQLQLQQLHFRQQQQPPPQQSLPRQSLQPNSVLPPSQPVQFYPSEVRQTTIQQASLTRQQQVQAQQYVLQQVLPANTTAINNDEVGGHGALGGAPTPHPHALQPSFRPAFPTVRPPTIQGPESAQNVSTAGVPFTHYPGYDDPGRPSANMVRSDSALRSMSSVASTSMTPSGSHPLTTPANQGRRHSYATTTTAATATTTASATVAAGPPAMVAAGAPIGRTPSSGASTPSAQSQASTIPISGSPTSTRSSPAGTSSSDSTAVPTTQPQLPPHVPQTLPEAGPPTLSLPSANSPSAAAAAAAESQPAPPPTEKKKRTRRPMTDEEKAAKQAAKKAAKAAAAAAGAADGDESGAGTDVKPPKKKRNRTPKAPAPPADSDAADEAQPAAQPGSASDVPVLSPEEVDQQFAEEQAANYNRIDFQPTLEMMVSVPVTSVPLEQISPASQANYANAATPVKRGPGRPRKIVTAAPPPSSLQAPQRSPASARPPPPAGPQGPTNRPPPAPTTAPVRRPRAANSNAGVLPNGERRGRGRPRGGMSRAREPHEYTVGAAVDVGEDHHYYERDSGDGDSDDPRSDEGDHDHMGFPDYTADGHVGMANAMAVGVPNFRPMAGMTMRERDHFYQGGALDMPNDPHHQGQHFVPTHHDPEHHDLHHHLYQPAEPHGHGMFNGLEHQVADLGDIVNVMGHQHGMAGQEPVDMIHPMNERMIQGLGEHPLFY